MQAGRWIGVGRRACISFQGHTSPVAGGWCDRVWGRLKSGAQWAGGAEYGWPERYCCACGRARYLAARFEAGRAGMDGSSEPGANASTIFQWSVNGIPVGF